MHILLIERQEKGNATNGKRDRERVDIRPREGGGAEKAERHHRSRDVCLHRDERAEQHHCRRECREDECVTPATVACFDQRPRQRCHRAGNEHGAGKVKRDLTRLIPRFPYIGSREDEGEDADGHIDEKDPVPRRVLHERATNDRAKGETGNRNRGPDADCAPTLLRRKGNGDERQRERHDKGRAQPLKRPRRDQHPDVLRERAKQGRTREQREAAEEPSLATQAITETTRRDLD